MKTAFRSTIYSQSRQATQKQRMYLDRLGVSYPNNITVVQASNLITENQSNDLDENLHPMDQGDHD